MTQTKIKSLTPRETEVLRDIAAGLPTREIAVRYAISKATVSTHRRSIIRKTGCRNCAAAAVKILSIQHPSS